ncbi:MAG: hypothetical protein CM1200mP41_29030 [Gammaproteobacteria bacterium]|nr:MAG: hypothetical protein CM1200mP41_29030 [Gammaproteobacteria bacterium]
MPPDWEDPIKFARLLTRFVSPFLYFLISLVAMAAGFLMLGSFCRPALTPIFLNLSLIGAVFVLIPHFPNAAVALRWVY